MGSVNTCQRTSAKRRCFVFVGTLVPVLWERAGLARLLSFLFFQGKAKHSEMETLGEEIAFLSVRSCSSQAQLSFTLQGFPFI